MLFNKKYLNLYIIAIIVMVAILLAVVIPSATIDASSDTLKLAPTDNGISFSQILTAPIDGLIGNNDGTTISSSNSGTPAGAISLVLLVLGIGSFVSVCVKIGLFDSLIDKVVYSGFKIETITFLLITYFTTSAIVYGLYETAICYLPVLISLYKKYNVKPIYAVKLLLVSVSIGYMSSPINPFATVVADQLAGVNNLFLFRTVFMLVLYIGVVIILLRDLKQYDLTIENQEYKQTKLPVINLILFLIPYVYMTIGFIPNFLFSSTNPQVTIVFVITAFILAKLNGQTSDEAITSIIGGINSFMIIAISITLARSVYIILLNGQVIDPIIYGIVTAISNFNPIVIIILILIVYGLFAYGIPSPSALAMITLPILVPSLMLVGISSQVTVTVYLVAHGLSKLLSMTSSLVISCLDEAGVTYNQYTSALRTPIMFITLTGLVMIFSSYLLY